MPVSVPPAPSFPGVAQIFASASVRTVSEELDVASPLYETVATFETVPAAFAMTVIVIGAEVAPAASVPMLQVTGPVPAQPVWDTNVEFAGMASVIVTFAALAAL